MRSLRGRQINYGRNYEESLSNVISRGKIHGESGSECRFQAQVIPLAINIFKIMAGGGTQLSRYQKIVET